MKRAKCVCSWQVYISQGKEPPQFLALFKCMCILKVYLEFLTLWVESTPSSAPILRGVSFKLRWSTPLATLGCEFHIILIHGIILCRDKFDNFWKNKASLLKPNSAWTCQESTSQGHKENTILLVRVRGAAPHVAQAMQVEPVSLHLHMHSAIYLHK